MLTSISAVKQSILFHLLNCSSRWGGHLVFLFLCTFATVAEAGQVNTSLTKSIINPGETTTLKIDLKNPLLSPLENLRFSTPLVLPTGMTITNAASFTATGCGSIALNLASDRKSFNISGGTIPAAPSSNVDGNCTISLGITTTTQGNSTITLPATTVLNNQNETNANPAQITLQVNNIVAPTISLGFNPNTVSSGQPSTLTIGIKNNDSKLLMTGVNLQDSLPANLSISGAASTSNCGTGTIATSANASGVMNTYNLSNATIATGATCTITFPVISNTSGTYKYEILNTSNKFTNNQGLISSSSPSAPLAVQDLLIFTSFNPTTTTVNQPAQLIIDLENWGTADATKVTLTDTLPANLVIAATPNITNSCNGDVTATTNSSTNISTIKLGNRSGSTVTNSGKVDKGDGVDPGRCRITVDVVSTAAATYTNTIAANAVVTNEGATNPYAVAATLKVIVLTGNGTITVDKSFSPKLIAVNSRSQLEIKITNSNTTLSKDLTNLNLVDNFASPLLKIASPANTATTCTGGTIVAVPGSSSLSISGGKLLKGKSCTIQVDVTSDTPTTTAAPYSNTIDLGSITTAEGETNSNSKTASLTVSPGVEVTQAFSPATISANGRSILVVTIKNYLPYAVTGVSLTDPLPQNAGKAILVDLSDHKATTCMGGSVTIPTNRQSFSISGATIPAGVGDIPGICTFQVDVTSSAATNTSNTAKIPVGSIVANQPGISNTNSASAKLTFRNDLNITVNKSFDPIEISPGGYSTAIITVGNSSDVDYPDLEFTDTPQAGMQVANVPNPTTNCLGGTITAIPGAASFNFKGQKLAANTSCQIKVRVTSTKLINLVNEIYEKTISSSNGVKNKDSASATLVNNNSLGVTKSFSPAIVAPKEVSQLRIEIYNPYTESRTGLTWRDTLISGLKVDTATTAMNTCGGTLNITTNPIDSIDSITLTGGNIPAQSSCAVTLGVKSTTAGSYLNTIPANRPDLTIPTVGVTTAEGSSNYYEAKDTLIVTNQPKVTKSFTPTSIAPYGVSTLNLTLTNPNDADSNLTQDFVDIFPSGMTVASVPNINVTGVTGCTKTTVVATAGDNKVTILNGALLPQKTTGTPDGGCTISIDVNATTVGTYTNRIPGGTLQTTKGRYLTDATADLTVAGNGKFRIVKRITGINGTATGVGVNGTSIDLSAPSNDTESNNWPNSYIRGAKDGGFIRSGDTIEYTVYFLSNGNYPVTDVSI
jgi:uncharacterized repeat protein (TIGR01451 family)